MPLRDVLVPRPRILFVGINPGLRSEALGHHFAGAGNPFWRLLVAARFVPAPFGFEDDRRLGDFGLAITNLCPRASRSAAELEREEIQRGRSALDRKIRRVRPEVVALVGITLYSQVLGKERLGEPGPGLKPDVLHGARVFVLPNPSGLNASYPSFASKLKWFRKLRATVGGDPRRAGR